MKKRNLKLLKVNKVAIATFNSVGGRAPQSNGCADPYAPPVDHDHEWFTDGPQRVCETFASWCSFTTG
ncbi:hypothetical protein [uncultured Kordia sp.]|uniref:hypothetical protein n=1 Tax=uncultured Kordia sp. TaxID=507699 RepID=UPI002636A675|nr:hypothetical protein [uncultured Kordia sp.]